MRTLLKSNPEYRQVVHMRVDWDTWRDAEITKSLKIPRRSTLVMFNKGEEVARVVAQTSQSAIEALFKAAM